MQIKTDSTDACPSRRKWLRRLSGALPGVFALLLISAIVVLAGQIKTESEALQSKRASELRKEEPRTNVVALALAPGNIKERLNLPGVVKPWIELKVVSEVQGKIISKIADEGLQVKKGDVLAVIDARDYQNALTSAQASYEAAQASHERLTSLFGDQLATQSQLDDAVARVKTTKAAMDIAALDLERCTIRAPIDGVVDHMYCENGQFMNKAEPVAKILQIDRIKVSVGIPESDVDAVRRVERFVVAVDALDGRQFEGRCRYLTKTADSMARLYNLEIAIDNSQGVILPDMFARVEIIKNEVTDGLAVPLYALLNYQTRPAVYVVEDEMAHLQPVSIGIQDGWRVQVKDGLTPGDRVVVVGQHHVDDGQAVNVTRTVHSAEELSR